MSAPEAFTVKMPFTYEAEPAIAGVPTSVSAHGDGKPGGGVTVRVRVAECVADGAVPVTVME